ncbi:MAG: CobW family GTP-binding protein [Bradyrhizobium sp.]
MPPQSPLPVTIVSGYLGAGKTTLINAILAGDHGLRIAVLVNDFGKVAIDEGLISGRDGDVFALSNGCMCCQIGGDLYDAIDRVLQMRGRFDHLLIETSGVADPSKVAQIAIAEPDLDLAHVVVLVDAVNFADILDDPRLNDTLLRQVRAADIVLVTKSGSAAATALADLQIMLVDAGASASVRVLQKAEREAWRLLDDRNKSAAGPMKAYPLGFHVLPFESWSWSDVDRIDADKLIAFAQDSALNIYRLKGRLHLNDGRSIVLHKVGSGLAIEDAVGTFETSELVAIGTAPAFDPARVQAAWMQLILRPGAPRP